MFQTTTYFPSPSTTVLLPSFAFLFICALALSSAARPLPRPSPSAPWLISQFLRSTLGMLGHWCCPPVTMTITCIWSLTAGIRRIEMAFASHSWVSQVWSHTSLHNGRASMRAQAPLPQELHGNYREEGGRGRDEGEKGVE